MRSGALNQRMTIRGASTSDDGRGGQAVTWADVDTDWFSARSVGTREYLQAGALQNAAAHTVRCRYRPDLTVKHRLYWIARSLVLSIVSIGDPDGRGRELEMECVEVDS
jgi:SPP1 family predicted phage head-tail adaptor